MAILKRHGAILVGLGITILFLGLGFFHVEFIDTLELKFYDFRMGLRGDPEGPSDVVLVDINDDSIEKLGGWPWPRSLIAMGIRKINAGGPKVIGLSFVFGEPQNNTVVEELKALEELFVKSVLHRAGDKGRMFLRAMSDVRVNLDNDTKLAKALKESGNVVLPVFFKEQAVGGKGTTETEGLPQGLPQGLIDQSIQSIRGIRNPKGLQCPWATEILLPMPAFFKASRGVGHINHAYDMDGAARRERLLYKFNGLYIPSYALRLAAAYLNVPQNKIRADLGSAVHLGSLEIPITLDSELLVNFKGPRKCFSTYPYVDVVNDKIPWSAFKNKLVLVSASAAGIMDTLSTPTDPTMSVGEFSANTIWTILKKEFVQQLPWGHGVQILMIVVLGLVITFVLPRLKAVLAGMIFLVFLVSLMGGSTYFFVSKGLWIQVAYPVLQLVLGYIGVLSIRHFVARTGKDKVLKSTETNRMLGILYDLALDYEKKKQFSQAAEVYEYIEKHDSNFKDVRDRKKNLMRVGETTVFGERSLDDGSEGEGLKATGARATLGRYEVIKQLGKGAMGVVYLGQDPRIKRTTAIKAIRFADDFEPEEAEKMKERFFREARSAGTLSHPNIVTIYDAGEEQGVAYIAMEYLEGDPLAKYTEKGNLLPMRKVINYIADIADALDYAHQKGIVHRDIKPANIMLLNTGIVKITDFGIARIAATSQTRTGVVKGTPFYMSPEQFSGEKVDGRSDIFSLGTMLFQLLTGRLPFYADNPPELMHLIMNEPHPDPKKINPKIAKPLVTIINKALEKDPGKRYQRGSQVAAHLREVGKRIDDFMAKKKTEKAGG